jgi:hypothetical protein
MSSAFQDLFESLGVPMIKEHCGEDIVFVRAKTNQRLGVSAKVGRDAEAVGSSGDNSQAITVWVDETDVSDVDEGIDYVIVDGDNFIVEKITHRKSGRWGLYCV